MISSKEILRKMVHELETRLGDRLEKMILIGSMARRDNTPESDYDCIAIVDEITPDLIDAIDKISGDMLYNYNAVFSIIPVTEARYSEQVYNPLFINAGREGVVVWPSLHKSAEEDLKNTL